MTTWKDIIAINDTTSDIFLEDLGLTIPASSQVDLHEQFEFSEIANADPLKVQVAAGNIIINDGTTNLSITDGLNYIDYWGKYEYDSEQAFIEGYEYGPQYLVDDDTYKILEIGTLSVDPENARLDGTTEVEVLVGAVFSMSYEVGFYYTGNAAIVQYSTIIEINDTEVPRTISNDWTQYIDTRVNLGSKELLVRLNANDRIKIKAKASWRYDNVTIEYSSLSLRRLYD